MVSTSLVSGEPWPSSGSDQGAARSSARIGLRKTMGFIDDAVLLLVVVWLFPIAIVLLGAIVTLPLRLLLEIVQRF